MTDFAPHSLPLPYAAFLVDDLVRHNIPVPNLRYPLLLVSKSRDSLFRRQDLLIERDGDCNTETAQNRQGQYVWLYSLSRCFGETGLTGRRSRKTLLVCESVRPLEVGVVVPRPVPASAPGRVEDQTRHDYQIQ